MTVGQTSAGAGGHAGQRQVYWSDSGTLTADQLVAKFDRLALQVYVGARDGTLLFEARV